MSSRALAQREVGQYPLSIATSLALEGAFGVHPDHPTETQAIKEYKEIWINCRTLVRNIDGAIHRDEKQRPKVSDYYHCLVSEMTIIRNHLKTSLTDFNTVFYVMSYKSLPHFWPHAVFKETITENQREYAELENAVMTMLHEDHLKERHGDMDIIFYDTHINRVQEKAIALTHFPIDLLLTVACRFEALLESHTGKLKTPLEWNTKLKDGRNHPRIPFDRCMLQIFGDSSGIIKPQTLNVRKKILEIAEKNKWNAGTTKDRVLLCVKLAKEPVLYDLVRRLY